MPLVAVCLFIVVNLLCAFPLQDESTQKRMPTRQQQAIGKLEAAITDLQRAMVRSPDLVSPFSLCFTCIRVCIPTMRLSGLGPGKRC